MVQLRELGDSLAWVSVLAFSLRVLLGVHNLLAAVLHFPNPVSLIFNDVGRINDGILNQTSGILQARPHCLHIAVFPDILRIWWDHNCGFELQTYH
jgi:hypothetical protein